MLVDPAFRSRIHIFLSLSPQSYKSHHTYNSAFIRSSVALNPSLKKYGNNGELDRAGEPDPASLHRPRRSRRRGVVALGSSSFRRCRRRPGSHFSSFNLLFHILLYLSQLICFFCGKSQSSGKSSVLESVVGRDFLPRGSGNSSFTFFLHV